MFNDEDYELLNRSGIDLNQSVHDRVKLSYQTNGNDSFQNRSNRYDPPGVSQMYQHQIDDLKKRIGQLSQENQRLENDKAEEIEKTRQMFNAQADKDRFELTKLRGQSLYFGDY